jgi:hypothetical protein
MVVCDTCDYTCRLVAGTKKHVPQHAFSCETCAFTGPSATALKKHALTHRVFPCETCEYTGPSAAALTKHSGCTRFLPERRGTTLAAQRVAKPHIVGLLTLNQSNIYHRDAQAPLMEAVFHLTSVIGNTLNSSLSTRQPIFSPLEQEYSAILSRYPKLQNLRWWADLEFQRLERSAFASMNTLGTISAIRRRCCGCGLRIRRKSRRPNCWC